MVAAEGDDAAVVGGTLKILLEDLGRFRFTGRWELG